MVRTRFPAAAATVVALGILSLAACSDGEKASPAAAASTAPTSASPSPSSSPTPSPADRDGDGIPDGSDAYPDDPTNTPRLPPITLDCELDDDFSTESTYEVARDKDGKPDFTAVWAAKPVYCETDFLFPVTDLEKSAHKISKYDDNDISTLYEICAEVDPDDVYAGDGFAASEEQIPEIKAALTLCPKHPHAAKWRAAVKRGEADLKLASEGRLFGPGTFLVGKEIRPGTYVTTDVEGCYWERQNSSGEIIANNFIVSARRVQVTIRSSDYAFHSERCGEWRPAR